MVLSPIKRIVHDEVQIVFLYGAQSFIILCAEAKKLMKVLVEVNFMSVLVFTNETFE